RDLQESFWSAGKSTLRRPMWRRLLAYRRAIAKTSLPAGENLALYRLLLRMLWSHRRRLSSELIYNSF
ncbi:MAG: hypothetical protein AAFU65_18310, partial [Pseudomonadota bacterium]